MILGREGWVGFFGIGEGLRVYERWVEEGEDLGVMVSGDFGEGLEIGRIL